MEKLKSSTRACCRAQQRDDVALLPRDCAVERSAARLHKDSKGVWPRSRLLLVSWQSTARFSNGSTKRQHAHTRPYLVLCGHVGPRVEQQARHMQMAVVRGVLQRRKVVLYKGPRRECRASSRQRTWRRVSATGSERAHVGPQQHEQTAQPCPCLFPSVHAHAHRY